MDDFKLRMKSRKLKSGKVQVDFSVTGFTRECYGYLLAEPDTAVRDVVEKIGKHAGALQWSDRYYQKNLYSLGNREVGTGSILIFTR